VTRAWPLVLVLLAGCATFQALFQEDRPSFVPAEATRISGAYARAVGVASEDWMAERACQRAEREAYQDAGDDGGVFTPEMQAANACYDQPDAYETWVYRADAGAIYYVIILPRNGGGCFPKEDPPTFSGDRVVYEIDASTYKILSRQVEE